MLTTLQISKNIYKYFLASYVLWLYGQLKVSVIKFQKNFKEILKTYILVTSLRNSTVDVIGAAMVATITTQWH